MKNTVPVRRVEFADWKPIKDEVVNLNLAVAFFMLDPKDKQPGGYYANSHLCHYYKVDGVDYDRAFKALWK